MRIFLDFVDNEVVVLKSLVFIFFRITLLMASQFHTMIVHPLFSGHESYLDLVSASSTRNHQLLRLWELEHHQTLAVLRSFTLPSALSFAFPWQRKLGHRLEFIELYSRVSCTDLEGVVVARVDVRVKPAHSQDAHCHYSLTTGSPSAA